MKRVWSCFDASKSRWSKSPIPFGAATPRCVKCCMLSQATASGAAAPRRSARSRKEFNAKLNELHAAFAALIADCLDAAVAEGQIPPIDTRVAAYAWYGAVNHVVLRWLLNGEPARLEETYPQLRALLLYGVTGAGGERRR